MTYRADIDGLRAVAVLAVLFYHFTGVSWFNGYMGVDIFFVISGFLITRIIAGELELGVFSLSGFYERRARRILPALFAVLCVSTLAAYFLLLPQEMLSYAKSLIGAALSVSNMTFWMEAGYFDLDAINKPLLHTWSLGIEEQFYILFPPILWAVYRYGRQHLRAAVIAIWLLSFAANILLIEQGAQSTAFYLIVSRAWELMTGSLIALNIFPHLASRIGHERLAWGGAVLLLAGFFWNADDKSFPGFYALMPVLGAAALIEAGRHAQITRVQRALCHRYAIGVGKISYSLYLWHWPLYVFATYYLLGEATWWQIILLTIACFGMSYLSWRYIEQPFRTRGDFWTRRKIFAAAVAGIVLFCALGSVMIQQKGRGPSYHADIATLLDVKEGGETTPITQGVPDHLTLESFGAPGGAEDARIAVWGDSHAIAMLPAFITLAKEHRTTGLLITRNACFLTPAYEGRIRKQSECIVHTQAGLDYLATQKKIKTVVLINYWAGHLRFWEKRMDAIEAHAVRVQSLVEVVKALEAQGKKVVVVAQAPEIETDNQNVPSLVARAALYGVSKDFRPTLAQYERQQADMMPAYQAVEEETKAQVIWPHKTLCDDTYCAIQKGNRLYYFDDDHLSAYGAEQLAPIFSRLFR